MLRRRWLGRRARALLTGLALAALGLAMVGTIGIAPTARASGPGPCTVAAQQSSLTAAGGVSARLSRAQGVTGTALDVTGSRWPAGATVTIDAYESRNGTTYIASPNLAQGPVSADGILRLPQFRAPMIITCSSLGGSADGGDVLFLVHTLDGHARAPLMFTYLAYLLAPQISTPGVGQTVSPGLRLTLNGARWEPNERVTITSMRAPWDPAQQQMPAWQPIPTSAVSVTADSQGAFSVMLPALDEPAETQITVFAEGSGPRYGDVGVYTSEYEYIMLPKVYPTLHLDRSGVNAGGAVTVSGDHWPAGVSGVVEYCRGQAGQPGMVGLRCIGGQHLGAFQADRAGHFSVTVHLPANSSLGPITVQARIPTAPFGLIVYAQGQPLSIVPTFAQAHPRLTRLIGMAPYLAGALVLLIALAVTGVVLVRRRRGGAQIEA